MKSSFISGLIISIVLALVAYFLFPLLNMQIENNLALAIGMFIGGFVVSLMKGAGAAAESSDFDEADASDSDSKTLYVGNLPYRANEEAVQEHFEQQGHVHSVRLMKDRRTGKRKGYGFVEMDDKGANKAIKKLNDSEFQERTLKVRLAKDKVEEN